MSNGGGLGSGFTLGAGSAGPTIASLLPSNATPFEAAAEATGAARATGMALNAQQAIVAGQLGAEIIGLNALTNALMPAINGSWQISGVTISFVDGQTISGALVMTASGSKNALNTLVASLNAEVAAATATINGL